MTNLRFLLIPVACAALAPLTGCVDPQDRADNAQSPLIRPPMLNTRPATYDCDDSGRVVVRPIGEDGKTVVLALASREVQMKSVPSDEGQKYSDGQTVFWMNGAKASLLVAGQQEPESCERPE